MSSSFFGFDKAARRAYTVDMTPTTDHAFVSRPGRRGAFAILGGLLIVFLLCACAGYANRVQAQNFAKATRLYGKAIQWSDFEAAANFLETLPRSEEIAHLKAFKVTAYEIRRVKFLDDQSHVNQTVAIRYYKADELIERTITDHQSWVYHPQEESWYLESGLPVLK